VEARGEADRQVGIRTAKKETTVKIRAYSIVLAALVALTAASGASAKLASAKTPNVKVAKRCLVEQSQKAAQKAAYRSIDRRAGRATF
jgi:hypothetical protein